MCHSVSTEHPFVHTSLLANIHCSESLVWLKTSGFFYTINTVSSLGLLLAIQLSPCTGQAPSHTPVAVGVSPLKALDLGLDGSELVSHQLSSTHHGQGELSSTAPCSSSNALANKRWGQFSCSHAALQGAEQLSFLP